MRLTRSQVARRIGRTIATVRQMEEYGVLTPTMGSRGTRLFDVEEVDEVSERIECTGRALPAGHLDQSPAPDVDTAEHSRRQILEQTRRILELEARERIRHAEHDRFRENLVDAVTELINVAKPHNRAMVDAVERILDLLA
jgi:DNA-binding transcriptional MerR regulator